MEVKESLKVGMMMVAAEMAMAGVNILYKVAANDGMHMPVLVTYRYLFATTLILPLAFFLERNRRPKLTWSVLFHAFLSTIFGGPLVQNLFAECIVITSATFATAFITLVPVFTFVVGVLFRSESVEIGSMAGKAKVIGTVVGIGGAMLLTFYKGHQLNLPSTHFNILHGGQPVDGHVATTHNTATHRIIGPLLAVFTNLCVALSLIFQGKMSCLYPCPYSGTCLITTMGLMQSLVFGFCYERSWREWRLGWDVRLLSSLFAGIGLILTVIFTNTSLHLRGPVFVSNFNPLMLVFVEIGGFFILDEKLRVGSVLGSAIIIVGLYIVSWGKSNTKRLSDELPSMAVTTTHDTTNQSTTADEDGFV